MINTKKNNLIILSLVITSFVAGYFFKFPASLAKSLDSNSSSKFISSLEKGSNDSTERANMEMFWKAWNTINEKYIDSSKLDTEKRIYGAIQGMVAESGDPYTMFFPPEEAKKFAESIKGEFSGIGAEIGLKDNIITVIAPLKDSPSFKAGLKSGDKILKIDDISTEGFYTDEAINLIRGKKGTVVTLTVYREGENDALIFKITRDTIIVPTVETNKFDKEKTFVISLYSFNEKASEQFKEALDAYKKTNYKKLIIDLRGNPGGYLESAVDIANWFLEDGKVIVYEDFGKDKGKEYHRSTTRPGIIKDSKVLVLVDGGSASASEILAGALKDNGVAKIAGQKTYGKGSVQELLNMGDGSSLKVTIAKWFTPNGVSISDKGIVPDNDITISQDEKDLMKDDPTRDIALEKALKLLN